MLTKTYTSFAAVLCLGILAASSEGATRRAVAAHPTKPAVVKAAAAKATPQKWAARGRRAPVVATAAAAKPTTRWVRGRKVTVAASPGRTQALATRPTRSATPASPSQDRYREIQQALLDKGYYKGSVDGTWNSESQDALRRFQADQSLTTNGKLDSLSLIALGLGPKRDNSGMAANGAVIGSGMGMNR